MGGLPEAAIPRSKVLVLVGVLLVGLVAVSAALAVFAAKQAHKKSSNSDAAGTPAEALKTWVNKNGISLPIGELETDPDTVARFVDKIKTMAKDVEVFGFGEPDHGFHEFAQLRNEAFKSLASDMGFRCITLETGIIEAHVVDQYVTDTSNTRNISLETVLATGFTHDMGEWEETRDLVSWVRTFNENAAKANRPLIRWGGKDLSVRGDTLVVPLDQAMPFFTKVGAANLLTTIYNIATKASQITTMFETVLRAKVGIEWIDPDHLDAVTSLSYDQISDAERIQIGTEITAILAAMTANKSTWIAKSSQDEFDWATILIVVTRQMWEDLETRIRFDVVYGQTNSGGNSFDFIKKVYAALGQPLPPMPRVKFSTQDYTPDQLASFLAAREASRERHLAENVLQLHATYGKTFNFAASSHLVRSRGLEDQAYSASEGYFIYSALKEKYVVVAGTSTDFVDSIPEVVETRAAQKKLPNSLESSIEDTGVDSVLIDVRTDTATIAPWLQTPMLTWIGMLKYQVIIKPSYDGIFWFPKATAGHRIKK